MSDEFRGRLQLELLYADDLVLMAKTDELLLEKLNKWEAGMGEKRLRVYFGKLKYSVFRINI